ncbi:MAG: hypothetical protein HWD60_15455 [Defluviicoccus sp.]|nr:MAG: hypothetical protein HWD60_15455 [Defluviicoccus sp.]
MKLPAGGGPEQERESGQKRPSLAKRLVIGTAMVLLFLWILLLVRLLLPELQAPGM